MIKYGEIGKSIYVNAAFDLNAAPFTDLKLNFSLGSQSFTRNNLDGVIAPAIDSPPLPPNPDSGFPGGVLPADTYALYVIQSTDWDETAFNEPGVWSLCLEYEDADPTLLIGDESTFVILEGCNAV